jgi:hypothetical protein
VQLVDLILDNRISCSFIETSKNENIIFCRPLEESLDNVSLIQTKDAEFIHSYLEESTGCYLLTNVSLDDGTVYENVRFKIVIVNEGVDLPVSTVNLSTLGTPASTNVLPSIKLIQEVYNNTLQEEAEEEDDFSVIYNIPETHDSSEIINKVKKLESKLVAEQDKLNYEKQQLKKERVIVEDNRRLAKTLEDYKAELLQETFLVTTHQKELLEKSIDKLSNSFQSQFDSQQINVEKYLDTISISNLDEIKKYQDLQVQKIKGEISVLLSEHKDLNKDDLDKQLLVHTDELEKLLAQKLTLELESHKRNLSEEIESITLAVDRLVEEKLKIETENVDKLLVSRSGALQVKLTDDINSKLAEHKDSLFKEFKDVSTITASELFSSKTEELNNALESIINEHRQGLNVTVEQKLNEVSSTVSKFTANIDGKLPQLEDTIKDINKRIQNLVLEKKNIQLVVDDARKYTDTKVAQVSEEVMNYARRILDLGGGGGSNAVQYANGGTMNGDLNVTGQYLSGGVSLFNILSGSGGGQGNPAVNALVISSSANWNTAYASTTALNLSSGNWNTAYTVATTYQNASGSFITAVSGTANQINTSKTGSTVTLSLPSNAVLPGNVTILGNLSAQGTATFANTVFSTTSALSAVANSSGPALYIGQSGSGDLASFYDLSPTPVEVLHIGASVGIPGVGIYTSTPNKELTVVGEISATKTIYASGGNSDQWNKAFNISTNYQSTSSSFATNTLLQSTSALLTPLTLTNALTGLLVKTTDLNSLSATLLTRTDYSSSSATLLPTTVYQSTSALLTPLTLTRTLTSQLVLNTAINSLTGNWNSAYNNIVYIPAGGFNSIKPSRQSNTVNGCFNVVSNGFSNNIAYGNNLNYSFIGNGECNSIICQQDTGGIGFNNIVGGSNNVICTINGHSNIVGGCLNKINYAGYDSIVGGYNNCIDVSDCGNFIGGGSTNNIFYGTASVVTGGSCNKISGYYSNIVGGFCNTSSGYYSNIVGGICNTICGDGTGNSSVAFTNIIGGNTNIIQGTSSGYYNSSTEECIRSNSNVIQSSILGGANNTITDCNLVYNTSTSSSYSTIIGGNANSINNNSPYNLIGGGSNNRVYGCYNTIVGGQNNSLSGSNSFTLGSNISVSANNYTFVNNLSSQGIVAALGGNSNNWNSAYASTTALNLSSSSWNSVYSYVRSTSATNNPTYNAACYVNVLSEPYILCDINGGRAYGIINTRLPGQGNTACAAFAGCPPTSCGFTSVLGGQLNSLYANFATIVGGCNNKICCVPSSYYPDYTVIAGGGNNTIISGCFSNINGGQSNTVSGLYSNINGGKSNTVSGYASNVAGGCINTASGTNSNVAGGYCNTASGNYSNITSGVNNIASGQNSSINNGYHNTASGIYSIIINGGFNCICSIGTGSSDTSFTSINNGVHNNISSTSSGYYNGSICQYIQSYSTTNNSAILGGSGNTITDCNLVYNTTTSSAYSTIIGGKTNRINNNSPYNLIGGGLSNQIFGSYNTIVGGQNNSLSGTNNFTLGSNISVSANNYTFVNNLSSQGIVAAANLTINKAPQTFVNPVTASGTFLVVNVNGTNQAIQLWNYSS